MKRVFVHVVLISLFYSKNHCFAGSEYDRVSLNWQNMRISFFGESEKKRSLVETEKAAIADGIAYIVNALPGIRMSVLNERLLGSEGLSRILAKEVSRRTYEKKVIYFQDGSVKVLLESALAKALSPQVVELKNDGESEGESNNSSIVIELDIRMDPQVTFRIQNEKGQYLYTAANVSRSSYYKNLMGRFFEKGDVANLKYYGGKKPLRIKGQLKGDEVIVVDGKKWSDLMVGNAALLREAKLALVSP